MNVSIRKQISGYEVIDSGFIYGFSDSEQYEIDATIDGYSFRIIMDFVSDDTFAKPAWTSTVDKETNSIKFRCINYDSYGVGFLEPVKVATISGNDVFFFLWTIKLNDKKRKVDYVFYRKKS